MSALQSMSREQLLALVEKMKASQNKPLTLKVTEKGGVSVYGLGRFPVSLYASQWEKLIPFIKDGSLEAFLTAHADKLSRKDD